MSKYQKEDIRNLIKNDDSQNILKKIIKKERLSKLTNSKKMILPDNNKKFISNNNNFYYSSKKNYPNIKINSSNILNSIKLNNKSLYTINAADRFSTSNLNKINNKLIALKNYGSTKDLQTRNKNNNNHFIFISGLPETPSLTNNINLGTDNTIKNYNNIGKKEINSSKKSTTILYKRRSDSDKNNFSAIYNSLSSLNSIIKDNNNNYNSIRNYKINSITFRNNKNRNNEFKSKNISENIKYNNDSQTYNSKGNIFTYEVPKKETVKKESRFRTDDIFTFNPKEDMSFDPTNESLLYRRLKKNQTVDKKYQLLSVHNSSIGRNFFFNPLKNNLNNDLYSYTSSKDKIDINSYLKNIRNNNTSIHEIKTTKNVPLMKYIDRKDNNIINLDRFNNKTDRAKIDSIKKNLINYGNTKEVKIKGKIKSINNINKSNLNM